MTRYLESGPFANKVGDRSAQENYRRNYDRIFGGAPSEEDDDPSEIGGRHSRVRAARKREADEAVTDR